MESLETIGGTTWFVWALIGFIGGFMMGRFRARGGGYTILNIVVGMLFAMLGGWAFCAIFGTVEEMQYLSLVVSVLATALGLWIVSLCSPRNSKDDSDVPEP